MYLVLGNNFMLGWKNEILKKGGHYFDYVPPLHKTLNFWRVFDLSIYIKPNMYYPFAQLKSLYHPIYYIAIYMIPISI